MLLVLPILTACPSTSTITGKQEVKTNLIQEIKTKIEKLGAVPLTEDEAKYKGSLGKDKYIQALRTQLRDLEEKEKEKKSLAETKEKEKKQEAEKAKKEQNRKEAIQKYKKEILMLGETPMLEFEVESEDKYLVALKKQFDEAKKIQKEEEQKIKEAIPEWYQQMPIGTEKVMFARGTSVSSDLQFSEDKAVNAALLSLAKKLQNRLESKNKQMIKEAGLGEDLTLRTNIERAANIVIKNVQVSGYKIIKTKMAPMAKGGYRTYVLMEYPISLTYKNYLEQLPKESQISTKLVALKKTDAYKDLVEAANSYIP